MRTLNPWMAPVLLLSLATAVPALGAKAPTAAQLQALLKKTTQERDDLKVRLAATENLQSELAESQKARDLARQETDRCRRELEQMKGSLAENQGSSDALLEELHKAKADLAAAREELDTLKSEAAARKEKQSAPVQEGALVSLTPEVTPARPINLNRVTPRVRRVSGVVVVNVLISESGDVLDSRLLQGLPGEGERVEQANAACVESAKHVVFDPARAADGKTKVRVWQGVGFSLD